MRTVEEIWRPIKGYEGLYEVSNLGQVRTVKGNHFYNRKLVENKKGYLSVVLSNNGKTKGYYVHKLVAIAFPEICGIWFDGATINHKNENKKDNRPENLEYLSMIDNIRYGTGIARRGRIQSKQRKKITLVYCFETGELYGRFTSRSEASEATGVSMPSISAVINGRNGYKQSGGFMFKNG